MRSLIVIFFSLAIISCADKQAPRLMAPPKPDPKPQAKIKGEASATGLDVVYNPRVDILFVIDNSRSMKEDILTLRRNIRTFADKLSENSVMDYHIGAVTVFDSGRFTNTEDGVFKVDPSDGRSVLYLEKGELIPLKNEQGKRLWHAPRYVSRSNIDQLPSLFDVKEYSDPDRSSFELLVGFESKNIPAATSEGEGKAYEKVAFGPEQEETLSPIEAAIWPTNEVVKSANANFLRDDSLLVIIPLTDADSEDGLDPKDLFERILESRNNDVLSVGLLCPEESVSFTRSRDCRRKNPDLPHLNNTTSFEPQSRRIRQFIEASRQALPQDRDTVARLLPAELDIGSNNWGEKLAQIGNDIKKRVLQKEVHLGDDAVPQFSPEMVLQDNPYNTQGYLIEVFYGDTQLPNNQHNGWFYNRKRNTVIISENIDPDLLQQPNAQISVHFIEYHEGKDSKYYDGPADQQ